MAFCNKCGAELGENQGFCASCGAQVGATGSATTNQFDINETVSKILDTKDTTSEFDANDIEKNKVWAILSYVFILFVLPMFLAKDSKFANFHASQGLNLFLFEIACAVVGFIISFIPILNWIVDIVLSIAALALMVLGIYNAATGKAKELPLIGSIKIL